MTETDNEKKMQDENLLTKTLGSVFALAESYPELKADKQFLALQQQLAEIEDEISNSRKEFNEDVKHYNTLIESFPSNIFAKWFKHKKRSMFELEDVKERQNIEIDI